MKKLYTEPKLIITALEPADVIQTSGIKDVSMPKTVITAEDGKQLKDMTIDVFGE